MRDYTVLDVFFYFLLIRILGRGGVQTGFTQYVGHVWPNVPAPGDCEDGEFGWMKIGRGNRSTRREPAPAPLCPPQIPLDQAQARTQAVAVGSQQLTAWAMARPWPILLMLRVLNRVRVVGGQATNVPLTLSFFCVVHWQIARTRLMLFNDQHIFTIISVFAS
jgi:hypothetical protein